MFADDTKVYREISDFVNDTPAPQTDVDHLANWATLWQLRFNPEKCETMRITHNRDRSVPSYTMGSRIMRVKCTKDLGVLISSVLSWSAQVHAFILGVENAWTLKRKSFFYPVQDLSATYS